MNSLRMKLALAVLAMLVWSLGNARSHTLSQPLLCHQQMPSLPANVCAQFNISYGSDPKQMFDVYMPQTQTTGAPVILMVHGGSWSSGDKSDTPVVKNKVAYWVPTGVIFISVNYPYMPQANPLQQALYVAQALTYAQRQASSWGADPKKFILMGDSSGGQLVALISAEPSLATSLGAQPWLGTVALDSAAYDVTQIMEMPVHPPMYDQAFGTSLAFWNATSPIVQLVSRIAPFMAVCSSQRTNSCPQAQQFVNKAKSYGGSASLLQENLSHSQIDANLGLPSAYTTAVNNFLSGLYKSSMAKTARK